MPRYFFNLYNDRDVRDPEGEELPHTEAARIKAADYAVDLAAAGVRERRKLCPRHRIDVADERGEVLATVRFGDVVKVES
jgi:hypothetical protein